LFVVDCAIVGFNALSMRIFEYRVLMGISVYKRQKVMGGWIKLRDEKLNDFLSSPNNIRVVRSRRMKWAGHVTSMDEKRYGYRVFIGKPE
jgi:hypothetical protein